MKRERRARGPRQLDPDPHSLVRALGVAGAVGVVCAALAFVLLSGFMPAGVTPPAPESGAASDFQSATPQAAPESLDALLEAIEANDVTRAAGAASRLAAGVIDEVVGGKTPLMHAASLGDGEMMRMLLAHGADPNARGASQRTALQYAAERDRLEAARDLLDAGADIDGVDNTRLTPLIMAADRGHTELAMLLIERGADVNLVHAQGWTALIDAARTGNEPLVELLLRQGADPLARMPQGHTARDLAAQAGHANVVRLLDRAGRVAPHGALSTPIRR